ncbi:hypothetical protein BK140_01365 [Paenibacillus macerans]|nr:hypothetical protein BK140_01365 [Paenibacillus macerans]
METGTLLNYGTGSIRLLIPEEALSRQLTEYCSLMYPLHEETGAAAHWTFKIVGSELLEKCIRNTDRSALLQLEHDMAGFKGQNRQESWFLEAKRQWAVYINHKERQVHAWVSQDDPFNFARKLIRQIVSSEHQKAGAALIHASAVEYNGGAYVFAGDKGAGKTTVMMNLIAAGSAMYLGNDAVLLTPEARAVPVLAGPFVGLGTLGGIDKYRCLIPSKFAAALEARESSDYEASVQKKISFALEEVERLLSTTISKGANIKAIVFPTLIRKTESIEVEKISADTGAQLLQEQLMYDPNDHQNWLEINPKPDVIALKQHVKRYTDHTPMFRMRFGRESKDLINVFQRLVAEADI